MNSFARIALIASQGALLGTLVTTVNAQTVSLEHCITQALGHDPRALVAGVDAEIAGARIAEAKSALLPKVRGTADWRYYTDLPFQLLPASVFGGPADSYRALQFGTPQNVGANVQAQLPLVDAGSWERIHVAREAEQAARLMADGTREDVVMDVSLAYYTAQVLQMKLAFLDSNVTNTGSLLGNVRLMREQSMARSTDVDRLQLQLDQLLTQRERVQGQLDQTLDVLRLHMGLGADVPLAVEPPGTTIEPGTNAALATTRLRAAEQGLRVQEAEIRLLKRSRLPSLNGQGLYGTTGFGPIGSEERFDFYPIGFIGASLQVPLFNGTTVQRRIGIKELERDKAALQRDALAERDSLDLCRTERDEALARRTLQDAGTQLGLAERIRKNTDLQHREGLATLSDLILADQSHRDAQQLYLDALVQLRRVQLERRRLHGTLIPR
jgi:outer membrane protein TolC